MYMYVYVCTHVFDMYIHTILTLCLLLVLSHCQFGGHTDE